MTPGYIYVLKSTGLGGFKCGMTRNVGQRMKALKVPLKAEIVDLILVDNPEGIEKDIHRHFDKIREPQSEWFNFCDADLEYIRSYCARYGVKKTKPIPTVCPVITPTPITYTPVSLPSYYRSDLADWMSGMFDLFKAGALATFILFIAGIGSTAFSEFTEQTEPSSQSSLIN